MKRIVSDGRRERWIAKQLAAGNCRVCGEKRSKRSANYCPKHRAHFNAMERVHQKAPHRKAHRRAWEAARYAERRAAGRCVDCGVKTTGGRVWCETHREYHNRKTREYQLAKRRLASSPAMSEGANG